VGSAFRTSLIVALAFGAIGACADTSNLAGGAELPELDAGPTKPRDAGSTPIDGDGGPIVATGRCDPTKPFGAPELVTHFDPESTTTKSAVLTSDELEVFYLRYVATGDWDLRHARRPSKDSAWGPVTTEAMTPRPEGFLSITAAGKKLYFWTVGQNYRAVRAGTSDAFGAPATYSSPSAPWTFVVSSDDTAYFAKYGDGATERFIHRASIDNSGFFASTAVPNIHVAGANDSRAVLNASETVMYFASNRPGGRGLDDVWVARRASKQEEFGPGTHVRELSTDDPDYVTWASDDDCVVYLDRASHVYRAQRAL
jgi:hypothetical protein